MDKCPFCGANDRSYGSKNVRNFNCGTWWGSSTAYGYTDASWHRSQPCYRTQLTALTAEVEELRGLVGEMGGLINNVNEAIYTSSMPNHVRDRRIQLHTYILQWEDDIMEILDRPKVKEIMKEV